MHTVYAVGTT